MGRQYLKTAGKCWRWLEIAGFGKKNTAESVWKGMGKA